MNNKVIGTIAAIGTIAYLYSRDVFNAEEPCQEPWVINEPQDEYHSFIKVSLDGSKEGSSDYSQRWYDVQRCDYFREGEDCAGSISIQGINAAVSKAMTLDSNHYVKDITGDYCANQTREIPADTSGDDEETTSTSTDWCSVKERSPTWIKEIEGEIAEERIRLKKEWESAISKMEKEGAAELKRIKDRYEESKKKCSAKEEVQKKLQDEDVGEGFWEKLLAWLNAG